MRTAFIVVLVWLASSVYGQTAQQWRDSLSTLHSQIERTPYSTDLRLKKAAVNIQLGQWEYAVEEYGRVLNLESKNLAALYYRAYCLIHLRQYALAKNDYETFLQILPTHMEARLGLASVCEKMGHKMEAMDQYNQLVEMFRDSAICYATRAVFETTQKQYDAALYDWDEAIRLQPQMVDYIVTKVDLLLQLNRRSEAREELEKALRQGVPRGVLKEWFDKCQKTTR